MDQPLGTQTQEPVVIEPVAVEQPAPVVGIPPRDAPEPAGLAAIELEIGQEPDPEPPPDVVLAEPGVSQSASPASGELPEALYKIVDARIMVWRNLAALHERRNSIRASASTREIRDELARQATELQRLPSREQLEKTQARIKAAQERLAEESSEQSPPSNSTEPSPETVYYNLLEIGSTQVELLLKRRQFDGLIPRAAIAAGESEPLFALCRRNGVDAESLIGWTFYAVAAQQRLSNLKSRESQQQAELQQNSKSGGGLLSAIRNAVGGAKDAVSVDTQVTQMRVAAEKELRAIEPEMVELFWQLYEEVAWLMASSKLNDVEKPAARALLRYGLVSIHPGMIEPDVLQHIVADCTSDVQSWQNSPDAMHVLYPDEYIPAICSLQTTPGPDEDLELNHRGTAKWKADHLWRHAISSRNRSELYKNKHQQLKQQVEQLEQKTATLEQQFQQLRSNPASKAQAAAVGQEIATIRPQLGRLRQAVEWFDVKLVPETTRRAEDCRRKLPLAAQVLTPEMVVRREARHIRRLARLASRLKEPYLPFVLRNWFHPGNPDHHSRKAVQETLDALEKSDPRIFHQLLIPAKRLDAGITIRLCPTFLVVPAYGQLGFTVCPRQPDDAGHFMLPLISQRQNMLENMLIDMLADYRWDCSKQDAGLDWLMADALCAAYASVRWSVRKLNDAAQLQAGFNRKQTDKQNWRYHYRLFITSAQERGRFLFSKSMEVYRDVVLKYIGMPPGIEPLRRD